MSGRPGSVPRMAGTQEVLDEVLDATLDDGESTGSEDSYHSDFDYGPEGDITAAFWAAGAEWPGMAELEPNRAEREEQNSLYTSASPLELGFSAGHIQDQEVHAQEQRTHENPATIPVSHGQVHGEGILNDHDRTSGDMGVSSVREVSPMKRSQSCGVADKEAGEPPYDFTGALLEGDSGFCEASPPALTEIGTGKGKSPGQKRKRQESSSPIDQRKKQRYSLILPGTTSSLDYNTATSSVTATGSVTVIGFAAGTDEPLQSTPQTHGHGTPTPADPASLLEQDPVVPAPDDEGYVSYFQSSEQAKKARHEHMQRSDPNDPTIPRTDQEKEALVKKLYYAMMDMSMVVEEGKKDSTGVKKMKELKADPAGLRNVQMSLWFLLDTCIKREFWGLLVPDWQAKGWKRKTYANFQARFDSVCFALRTQKSVAKRVIDLDFLDGFVDDPDFQAKRTEQNKKLNFKKGEHITLGRAVKNEQLLRAGGELPGRGKGRKRKAHVVEDLGEESHAAEEVAAGWTPGTHGLIEMQPPLQENQPFYPGHNQQYNGYNQHSPGVGAGPPHIMYNPQHHTGNQLPLGDRLPFHNINNLQQSGNGGYQDGSYQGGIYTGNNGHVIYDENNNDDAVLLQPLQEWWQLQKGGTDFDIGSIEPAPAPIIAYDSTPAPTHVPAPVPTKAAKTTKTPAKAPKAPKAPKNPPNKRRKSSNN